MITPMVRSEAKSESGGNSHSFLKNQARERIIKERRTATIKGIIIGVPI